MENFPKPDPAPQESRLGTRYTRLFATQDHGGRERLVVSSATRQQAVGRLSSALHFNRELGDILNRHLGPVVRGDAGIVAGQELTVVDGLRTVEQLRVEAGTYFLRKIDQLAAIEDVMPLRITEDTQKTPDKYAAPVSSMTSREYAALLCLAKLDGTFDDRMVSSTDQISINARGDMEGQSRFAADTALGIAEPPHQSAQ
ncbi:MAG: hypothetical protein JWN82_522 [Candidatus Saccharibacteria bacterium]|nr:hypothetical protein [Candidatus Saccharibacteria bacterium]